MKQEKFESLVKELEDLSEKSPILYKIKVLCVAFLGYGYIFGILFILLALIIGTRGRLAPVPLVIIAIVIIQSLRVKMTPPQGITVTKEDSLKLHQIVREIQRELKTPKVHEIILTNELNAAMAQYPRLGIFGYYKNYLIIGLPMLLALSEEEFKSVIAHEMGHLSGKHGKFGVTVYRLKRTWANLMHNMQGQDFGVWLFKHFMEWYFPFLDAYTYVLLRNHEYYADRLAAQVTDQVTSAQALVKFHVTESFLEEFWMRIWHMVKDEPTPIEGVYHEMLISLKNDLGVEQVQQYLTEALSQETQSFYTHPALSDRLKALGVSPDYEITFKDDAISTLFGNQKNIFLNNFSELWKRGTRQMWYQRRDQVKQMAERLGDLENQEQQTALTLDELFEKAVLVEELEGSLKALPLFEEICKQDPKHAPAIFATGRIYLENFDDTGIQLIESAIELDFHCTAKGCQIIHNYLISKGETDEALKYKNRIILFQQEVAAAKEERQQVSFNDAYCEHGLTCQEIEILLKQITQSALIKKVYLIQKEVQYFKDQPVYVIGLKFDKGVHLEIQQEVIAEILHGERLQITGDYFLVPLYEKNKRLEEIMAEIPDSRIFPAESSLKGSQE